MLKVNQETKIENQKFEVDPNDYWGIQILKMEIMNSSTPKVKPLIDFLKTKKSSTSVWDYTLENLIDKHGFDKVDWVLNESGNYECIIKFCGFPNSLEKKLLSINWFNGVDIDFYYDTRNKLGHSSYKWKEVPLNFLKHDIVEFKPVERVRHFTSKKYFYKYNFENYETYTDFIKDPSKFWDFEKGYFNTETTCYQKEDYKSPYYKKCKENHELLIHCDDYTVEEFNNSYSKLVELNTVIRPQLNEKDEFQKFKYHNCIKGWIKKLNQVSKYPLTKKEYEMINDDETLSYFHRLSQED